MSKAILAISVLSLVSGLVALLVSFGPFLDERAPKENETEQRSLEVLDGLTRGMLLRLREQDLGVLSPILAHSKGTPVFENNEPSADLSARLDAVDDDLCRLEEIVRLRCLLIVDARQERSLADTLYSARYFKHLATEGPTPLHRAKALWLLSDLTGDGAFISELTSAWLREAWAQPSGEVERALSVAASCLPRSQFVRAVLIDWSRTGDSSQVREDALRALAKYDDDDLVSWIIERSLYDAAKNVRVEAAEIIAGREARRYPKEERDHEK